MPPAIRIISFGYLHGEPPAAHLVVDLRHHFRDPLINPALRQLTAHDQAQYRLPRPASPRRSLNP